MYAIRAYDGNKGRQTYQQKIAFALVIGNWNCKLSISSSITLVWKEKKKLLQGLSDPEFYGSLVYKFRKIYGKIDFSEKIKRLSLATKR